MKSINNNIFKLVVVVALSIVAVSVLYYLVIRPIYQDTETAKIENCRAELAKGPEAIPDNDYYYDYRKKCAELLDGKGIGY